MRGIKGWRRVLPLLLLAALWLPTASAATPPDGAIDSSFGVGGQAVYDFGQATGAAANDLLVQPDGKMIAVGNTLGATGTPDEIALVRYNPDGSLDSSFGSAGSSIARFPYLSAAANTAQLLNNGKILVAGGVGEDTALLRYNANGTLDTSFGGSGKVVLDLRPNRDVATTMVVQDDGKIVLAGIGNNALMLARFSATGTPDPTFGTAGVVTSTALTPNYYLSTMLETPMLVLPDSKIMLIGRRDYYYGPHFQRLNSDGSVDTSFGDNGLVRIPTDYGTARGFTRLALAGDKILAAGYSDPGYTGGTPDFLLMRFNLDGTPDLQFGGHDNGSVTLDFQHGTDIVNDILVLPDGKVLLVGQSYGYDQYNHNLIALALYTADGILDTGFGEGGGRVLEQLGADSIATRAKLAADGSLLLAGYGGDGPQFALLHYNADGSPAKTFGERYYEQHYLTTRFVGTDSIDHVSGMAVQPDGKILLIGTNERLVILKHSIAYDTDTVLVRFNADGTLDTTFADHGARRFNFSEAPFYAEDNGVTVAFQADAKILVFANAKGDLDGSLHRWVVVRLLADGTFDDSYGIQAGQLDARDTYLRAGVVQPDGKAIIGVQTGNDRYHYGAGLLRLNKDGGLDDSFGTHGVIYSGAVGHTYDGIAIQPDGKIVTVGASEPEGGIGTLITRFNSDGSRDSAFGFGREVYFRSCGYPMPNEPILIQPDSKILFVCTAGGGGNYIARLEANGDFDRSFGDGGGHYLGGAGLPDNITSMALQPDGKILLGDEDNWEGWGNVVRLLPNGQLDSSFVFAPASASTNYAVAGLALLTNGQLLVGSTVTGFNRAPDFGVVRLLNRPTFADVPGDAYFHDPVGALAARGAISGYADGTFRPFSNTTRAQLAKIVVAAAGWPLLNPPTATFGDVPVGSPFYQYVETAAAHNLIGGYDGPNGREFRPGAEVTRGQLTKIVVLAAGWALLDPATARFTDVPVGSTFFWYIETAAERGVISGYSGADGPEYRVGNPATRGQIAKIVYLALPDPLPAEKAATGK